MLYSKCQKFGIMLYLVPNLAPCIAFVKFNAKFDIALENIFMPKYQILALAHKFSIALELLLNLGENFKIVPEFNRKSSFVLLFLVITK